MAAAAAAACRPHFAAPRAHLDRRVGIDAAGRQCADEAAGRGADHVDTGKVVAGGEVLQYAQLPAGAGASR